MSAGPVPPHQACDNKDPRPKPGSGKQQQRCCAMRWHCRLAQALTGMPPLLNTQPFAQEHEIVSSGCTGTVSGQGHHLSPGRCRSSFVFRTTAPLYLPLLPMPRQSRSLGPRGSHDPRFMPLCISLPLAGPLLGPGPRQRGPRLSGAPCAPQLAPQQRLPCPACQPALHTV